MLITPKACRLAQTHKWVLLLLLLRGCCCCGARGQSAGRGCAHTPSRATWCMQIAQKRRGAAACCRFKQHARPARMRTGSCSSPPERKKKSKRKDRPRPEPLPALAFHCRRRGVALQARAATYVRRAHEHTHPSPLQTLHWHDRHRRLKMLTAPQVATVSEAGGAAQLGQASRARVAPTSHRLQRVR